MGTRKSRRTFGVSSTTKYLHFNSVHCQYEDKALWTSGEKRLRIFSVHGLIGDDLESESNQLHSYSPLTSNQTTTEFSILVSNRKDVFLSDDEDVRVLASTTVPVDMSLPFEDRKVHIKFSFGGPEVKCHVFGPNKDEELGTIALSYEHF